MSESPKISKSIERQQQREKAMLNMSPTRNVRKL